MTRQLSPSLAKLPRLARAIERNHATATALLKRAFEVLVWVSSGPEGVDDLEKLRADSALDFLLELLDQQQKELEDAGSGASDMSHEGGAEDGDKPCESDLSGYETALKANDAEAAQRCLAAYSQCLRDSSGQLLRAG